MLREEIEKKNNKRIKQFKKNSNQKNENKFDTKIK
jgi:hypothetical protein